MDRISQPFAIAFDALDDIWVNNGYSNLTIYAQGLVVPIVSFNDNSNFIPALLPIRHLLGLVEIWTLSDEISHFLTDQSMPRREVMLRGRLGRRREFVLWKPGPVAHGGYSKRSTNAGTKSGLLALWVGNR